jgi:hypothetical protein
MKSELIQAMLHKNLDLLVDYLAVLAKLCKEKDGLQHHQLPKIISNQLLMKQLHTLLLYTHQLLNTPQIEIPEVQVLQSPGQTEEILALQVHQLLDQTEEILALQGHQLLDQTEEILILQAHHQLHQDGLRKYFKNILFLYSIFYKIF